MDFQHFDEKKSKLKFQGIFSSTYQRKFPEGIFEYVVLPNSARVLPITKEGKFLLLKEKSFSHENFFYTIPGGLIDNNETAINCAKRELEEETGYMSDQIIPWFDCNYSQTIISRKFFFIAKKCLKEKAPQLEKTEDIEVEELNFEDFLKKVTSEKFRQMELQNIFYKMRLDEKYKNAFMKKYLSHN
jgi:ADP-ribose pyrophosphatase